MTRYVKAGEVYVEIPESSPEGPGSVGGGLGCLVMLFILFLLFKGCAG